MSVIPLSHQQDFMPLHGLRVGISGAVPERELWGNVLDLDQIILRFVSQLSALVVKYGGEVVHGSHPSFTPVLTTHAQRFAARGFGKQLTLIASELFGTPPPVVTQSLNVARVILTPRVGDGLENDPRTRNDSLTALRLTIASEVDILVAIGGKLHQSTGYNPGVLEELTVARWREVPCFVVASYGGFAGQLESDVLRQFSAGNRMDEAESASMAIWSDDVDSYVGRLLDHFVRHRNDFIRDETASDWMQTQQSFVLRSSIQEAGYETRAIDTNEVHKSGERFAVVREAFEDGNMEELEQLLKKPVREREGGSDSPPSSHTSKEFFENS